MAVAEALVRHGYEVIGTCRDPRKLAKEEVVPGVSYLPLELASPHSIELLAKRVKRVDVLINSAGTSMIGPVEEARPERARALFDVNFFGPLVLTQKLIGPMREMRKGTVLFIGSMHAETSVPFSSMYAATKSSLRSLSNALRAEVREYGIKVAMIAPFHVHTTIPQERQYRADSPYLACVKRVKEARDRSIAKAPSPRVVAGKVLQILENPHPRSFYPAGRLAEIQAFLIRHLPRSIVDAVMRKVFHVTPGRGRFQRAPRGPRRGRKGAAAPGRHRLHSMGSGRTAKAPRLPQIRG
jgi:short-subunit dehydrogenase